MHQKPIEPPLPCQAWLVSQLADKRLGAVEQERPTETLATGLKIVEVWREEATPMVSASRVKT